MSYKKRGVLSVFEKNYEEKGKKSNISISRTTLYTQKIKFCMQNFFFKKCLFEYVNQFAVEKKTQKIFGGNFKKNFVVAIKKMLVIQFPYMEIVWLVFFFSENEKIFKIQRFQS